jgi:hypothetical protein
MGKIKYFEEIERSFNSNILSDNELYKARKWIKNKVISKLYEKDISSMSDFEIQVYVSKLILIYSFIYFYKERVKEK